MSQNVNQAAPVPAGGIRAILADVINRAGGVKGILAQVAVAAGTAHLQNAAMEASDKARELAADVERLRLERRRELARWEADDEMRLNFVRTAIADGLADEYALDRVAAIERRLRHGEEPAYAARIIAGWRAGTLAAGDPVDVVDVAELADDDGDERPSLAVVG